MSWQLESAARRLATRRKALLKRYAAGFDAGYDAADLHQLRVTLRRMRSLLKQRQGKKARQLRHRLSAFADVTNDARDWDTLLARARTELGPRQFGLLASRLKVRQEAAHLPIKAVLASPDWDAVIGEWDKYIRRHPPGLQADHQQQRSLAASEETVQRALQRAMVADRATNWHRLRIAVKEQRYRLDNIPAKARSADTRRLLRRCKKLQACLGDWHDTVVHLHLVRELALDFDPLTDHKALKLIRKWCKRMEQQGKDCLALAREELRGI